MAATPTEGLDEFVLKAMHDSKVPGVAVSILHHDQVIFSKGFGVQDLKTQKPVTSDTLFEIGSMSKAFTATALAMLVDAGQLKWDDQATLKINGLQLPDALSTSVTIRDLVSHRTGIGNENLVFWGSGLTTAELAQRAKFLPIHSALRTRFEYNNLLFALAGEAIPSAVGISWAQFVKSRIFDPLGMRTTFATLSEVAKNADLASGHLSIHGEVTAIPLVDLSNIAPAGSIVSNLKDMTAWARFQLGDGSFNGTRLLSSAALQETHAAQVVMRADPPFGLLNMDAKLSAYGLGWMLSDFHGHLLVQHPGDTDGMSGLLALLPDEQLAVVILTNEQGAWLRSAILFQILDAATGQPRKDRGAQYLAITQAIEAQQAKLLAQAAAAHTVTATSAKPTTALANYVGTYSNPLYGEARVQLVRGQLKLGLLSNVADLTSTHDDEFAVHLEHPNALQQLLITSASFKVSEGKTTALQIPSVGTFARE